MGGKFPQTCKQLNSPNNDIKSSLGYFPIIGSLPMSLNCILNFLREARGKFPRGNIPSDYTGGNIHMENPPSFSWNHEEISAGMVPWNSPINPRGNLGEVDGSPAGKHGWQGEQKLILDVVFSSHYSLHIGTDFLCVSNDIVVWSMAMILNHFFFSNSSYIGQNIPRRSIFMTIYFIFIINKNLLSFSHHSFSSGISSWHLCTMYTTQHIHLSNK